MVDPLYLVLIYQVTLEFPSQDVSVNIFNENELQLTYTRNHLMHIVHTF